MIGGGDALSWFLDFTEVEIMNASGIRITIAPAARMIVVTAFVMNSFALTPVKNRWIKGD
jgi:hypothetical protein